MIYPLPTPLAIFPPFFRPLLSVVLLSVVLSGAPRVLQAQMGIAYIADDVPPEVIEAEEKNKQRSVTKITRQKRAKKNRYVGSSAGRSPNFFASLWEARRKAMAKGADAAAQAAADTQLLQMIEHKETAGWGDFVVYAGALLEESEELPLARAYQLTLWAQKLAPNFPAVWWRGAACELHQGEYMKALSSYSHGFILGWTHPLYRRVGTTGLLLALFLGVLTCVFLFSVIAVHRHWSLFTHDIGHLLPGTVHPAVFSLMLIALVVTPGLFDLGVLWSAVICLTVMALYYGIRERIAAALLLLLLIVVGAVVPRIVVGLASHHSEQDQLAYGVLRLLDPRAGEDTVRTEGSKSSAQSLYVAGLRAHWSGENSKAEKLLSAASEAGAFGTELLTTIGNVRFARGNREGAKQAYKQAVEASATNVTAYFNLAQTFYALGDNIKGGEAHRTASQIDIRALSALTEQGPKKVGSETYVAPAAIPHWLYGDAAVHTLTQQMAVDTVWRWLCPISTRKQFALVALVAFLFLWVVSLLQKTNLPCERCERCGEPACQKCTPRLPNRALCGICYGIFVEQIDADQSKRVRREIIVRRYQSRRRQIGATLSLLVAGGGHLYRGFSLLGLFFLSLFCISVITFLAAMQVLPSLPADVYTGSSWGTALIAALTIILVFILSLWDFRRHQEEL